MIARSNDVIARARRLVGTPFRPQGRDPQTGLDCVGVVLCCFDLPPGRCRRNYRLRGRHFDEICAGLSRDFDAIGVNDAGDGDVLVCAVSAEQAHLAICCGESFIHADARLRRVVETPGPPRWPTVGVFRQRQPTVQAS